MKFQRVTTRLLILCVVRLFLSRGPVLISRKNLYYRRDQYVEPGRRRTARLRRERHG